MGTAASAVQASAKRGAIGNKSYPTRIAKNPRMRHPERSRLSGRAKDIARFMLHQIPPASPISPELPLL